MEPTKFYLIMFSLAAIAGLILYILLKMALDDARNNPLDPSLYRKKYSTKPEPPARLKPSSPKTVTTYRQLATGEWLITTKKTEKH